MLIQQRMVGEVAIIDMTGRLALADGDDLLRDTVNQLTGQGRTKIVLNLAGVPYMDSTGLGEVIRTYVTAVNRGGGLRLLRPTKRVQDLLTIARLGNVLQTFESEEDAVQSLLPSTEA